MSEHHRELRRRLREVATLHSVSALLSWDQETMMPARGGAFRAEQHALVARLAHETFVHPAMGEALAACEADPALAGDPVQAANLREIRRDYDRARRLPAELVAEMSETNSRSLEAWKTARAESSFERFRPWLDRQLELNRRKAACYADGGDADVYDILVDCFEPGMTGAEIERLFAPLRRASVELHREVGDAELRPSGKVRGIELSVADQKRFNARVVERLGFDLAGGRLDVSTHPFSTAIGPGDTRITTRYRADKFVDALSSTLHEAGHAMYEQGIPREAEFGQPIAESVSLGIHESQSRLWENHVGRSRAFWEWAAPEARSFFAPAMDGLEPRDFFRAVNAVRPHPIRVESDELTYNLHIMLRFDLERAMVRGELSTADLPAAWNDRVRSDLGLDVPDDRRGCLQDIHWAMGSFGYFPTYTLGNLYAAQFWNALEVEVPGLEERMARGEFGVILDWLRERIHRHGRRYTAAELCRRVAGEALGHEALIGHLRRKLGDVYRLAPT